MDKYLLQILKETNTIIIPGLGALTITDHSTGEVMFMPYLKHDDGALAQYISEREGMDLNDARNLVSRYVREIIQRLEQGETYDMYRFGSFTKDASGEIVFKNWEETSGDAEQQSVPPGAGMPETNQDVEETHPEPKKEGPVSEPEKIESEEILPDSTSRPNTADAEIAGNRLDEEREAIEKVKETELKQARKADKTPEKVSPAPKQKKPEPKAKKEKPAKVPKAPKQPNDKNRRRSAIWIFPVLAVVVVVAVIYGALNFEEVKTYLPFLDDGKNVKDTTTATDSKMRENEAAGTAENEAERMEPGSDRPEMNSAEDSSVNMETGTTATPGETITESPEKAVKTSDAKPVVESANSPEEGKPYHVIGGAFTEKTNADRYANKLSSEGNPSVIVGRFDQLYLVSIRSFATADEAKANLSSLQSVSSKAWIFKWP